MKPKLIIAVVFTTLFTFAGLVGHIIYLRHQRDVVAAAQAATLLELEGFRAAVTSTPKEVIKLVPNLVTPAIKAAVKKGTIKPIVAAAIEAKTTVEVPCPLEKDVPAERTEPVAVPVHLTFRANLLVTRIKFGIATEWKGGVGGTAQVGTEPAQELVFAPEDTKINVAFSDEIAKALHDHEAEGGFYRRHFRFTFPSVNVGYNVLDPSRPIVTSVGASWGYVW